MADIIFPRNNLNPDAVPWGRKIEEVVTKTAREVGRVSGESLSENRATAGQLGALGRQLNELQAREVAQYSVSDISITRSSGSGWGSSSRNFTVAGVGDSPRWAYVSFSGVLADRNVLQYMQVGGSLTSGNLIVGRQSVVWTTVSYLPSWFSASLSFGSLVEIPASGRTFTVTLDAQTLSGGSSRTATLTDIEVTVMFSDKV